WPQFYRGACAHRLGRYEEAVAAFGTCLALAPDSAPCYHNRALALAALGRRAQARRDLDRALRLAPGLAPAWLERGRLRYEAKEAGRPGAAFEQAPRLGADPASAHYNLALAYLALGDRAAALRHAREALARRADHAGARALLARLSS